MNILFRNRNRGFSLIEIMIVAILLAIFAGLAAINISEVFQQNKIKITYGELDSLRSAVGFAANDTGGVIPKLSFLNQNQFTITDLNSGGNVVTADFHYMGFPIGGQASTIYTRWKGPYLGIAKPEADDAGDTSISRKAGVARMLINSEVPNTSGNPNNVVQWPIDFWRNPYVIYMLRITRDPNNPNSTPFVDFIRRSGERPNFSMAYVSYGRDRVPGSYANNSPGEVQRKEDQKLFVVAPIGSAWDFEALPETDFNGIRLQGYSEVKFGDPNLIGVVDIGSDDIVIR